MPVSYIPFHRGVRGSGSRVQCPKSVGLLRLFAVLVLGGMLLTACSMTPSQGSAAKDDSLGGTAWRLVQIASMDDRVFVPGEGRQYSLNFAPDGHVSVQADCNRGQGQWTSPQQGQLEFGPLATTKALCPPGSLHDRFLSDLSYVRSYVFKDGHLFLATMADGAILEFTPMSP